jgi:branched-chain amino acid transport system substrate-binding protein
MKKNIIWAIAVMLVVIIGFNFYQSDNQIKIGIVSPLTGGAAYWGESASVGFLMAERELQNEGIDIDLIIEDGQLDPAVALNAAQKLVNVDQVNAIYSEFNPASISVSSFLKDKDVFHLYDSAAESPLDEGPYNFKTYLDYKDSCGDVSEFIKNNNQVSKIGVLKINLEFGDLCLEGVKEVFGEDNVVVETYNPGSTDFRTIINKIRSQNVDAIINASFQPETLASLRQLNEAGDLTLFVGLSETITEDIIEEYKWLIEGDVFFGLPSVSEDLKSKIDETNGGKAVADYNAAGLAYTHIIQLGKALNECKNDNDCVANYLSNTEPVESIGFKGFNNRIAEFENRIVRFEGGEFVDAE